MIDRTVADNASDIASCGVNAGDMQWLNNSVEAWRQQISTLQGVALPDTMRAVLYDADCQLVLRNAMTLPYGSPITFEASSHDGTLMFPDDGGTFEAPIGPMSATMGTKDGQPIFVMSLPSLWELGGVDSEELGREALMTAVLLHEGAHVFQFAGYGEFIGEALSGVPNAEDFDDDTLQEMFESNDAFLAGIREEQALFMEASVESSLADAIQKTEAALEMMKGREARFISENQSYVVRASDAFWSLEGSGQWIGYRWLADPNGGGFDERTAEIGYGTRGGSWSQSHGFAMAMALNRIDPDWTRIAFGSVDKTIRQMLTSAVEDSRLSSNQ